MSRKWYRKQRTAEYAKSHPHVANPKKTVCSAAVAHYFVSESSTRYLQNISDIVRVVRAGGFIVRSRLSEVPPNTTVSQFRNIIQSNKKARLNARYYIVRVPDHALLLDHDGDVLVDTDPRKRDRRKITHIYGVYYPIDRRTLL